MIDSVNGIITGITTIVSSFHPVTLGLVALTVLVVLSLKESEQ
jgi:hypothetical protein